MDRGSGVDDVADFGAGSPVVIDGRDFHSPLPFPKTSTLLRLTLLLLFHFFTNQSEWHTERSEKLFKDDELFIFAVEFLEELSGEYFEFLREWGVNLAEHITLHFFFERRL